MDWLLEDAWNAAKDRWHTPSGLILALVVVTATLVLFFAGLDLADVSLREWIVTCAIVIALGLVWRSTRIPRAPKNTVGIGIAVVCETPELATMFQSDFLNRLKALVQQSQLTRQLSVVEFGPGLSKRLCDAPPSLQAMRIMLRANLRLMLFLRARVRSTPSGPITVIDLVAAVRHAELPPETAQQFRRNINTVVPRRMTVPEGHFTISELAAAHTDIVARYLIGTAVAVSNDLAQSEQLLRDAETRLRSVMMSAEGVPLSALLGQIQRRLHEVYEEQLVRALERFVHKRDVQGLRDAEAWANRLRSYDPEHYGARLCAATCAFLVHRDKHKAMAEIASCEGIDDGAWRYSRAFLLAYDGDLDGAYKAYRTAFKSPLEDVTVPIQCEEFIQSVLDMEPDRHWLYYCVGLINHRAKRDLRAARTDFTAFINSVDQMRFATQVAVAKRWISEIDAELGQKSLRN